jgi:hypothetical protein
MTNSTNKKINYNGKNFKASFKAVCSGWVVEDSIETKSSLGYEFLQDIIFENEEHIKEHCMQLEYIFDMIKN